MSTHIRRFTRSALAAAVATAATVSLIGAEGPVAAETSPDVGQKEIPAPPNSENFGERVTVLSNGNYVVSDPGFDGAVHADVGAVYLFDGTDDTVISRIIGSSPNDRVGSSSIREVGDSDFLIHSPEWDFMGVPEVGAVTWVDGELGLDGVVSSANSLHGSAANDQVGGNFAKTIVLDNGNYVVRSPTWDNGAISDAGAATWADGDVGITGPVTTANSLYGTGANDQVGNGVEALANGNYVVESVFWNNTSGAATWADGTIGITGAVTAVNSLVGTTPGDGVGTTFALTNGNYVVRGSNWDNGALVDVGSVTWADGTTGLTGPVTEAGTLHGTTAGDRIGNFGITPLTNGNYVVHSPDWDNGGIVDAGASTWGDGSAGTTGPVTTTNSVHGTTPSDGVGRRATALSNGNYVTWSPDWDFGAVVDAGAATWGDGVSGTTGAVSESNSLHGAQANDGLQGVTPLDNGNYVVVTPEFDVGAVMDAGAVTFGDGTTGITGPITTANSLHGSSTLDQVGDGGVTPLVGGHYVASSPDWNDGAVTDAGAATWGDGTVGVTGPVSSTNSLVGSTPGDRAGRRITALTDGDFVATSVLWDDGATVDVGAATWNDGDQPVTGPITAANSLIGSTAGDRVGDENDDQFAVSIPDGDYLVFSSNHDNANGVDAGAVTLGTTDGIVGPVAASSSALGTPPGSLAPIFGEVKYTANDAIPIPNDQGRLLLLLVDRSPFFDPAPADVTAVADEDTGGAVVTYPDPNVDDVRTSATVDCLPASGSTFPIGDTTVTCTATDTAGLTATAEFTVTVEPWTDLAAVNPARYLDTRSAPEGETIDGMSEGIGQVAAGGTVEIQITGRGSVVDGAGAAMVNLAAIQPEGRGYATLYPCTPEPPTAASLNYDPLTNISNATLVKLSPTGSLCLFSSQPAHYAIDVVGYTPPGSLVTTVDPGRFLDTRTPPEGSTIDDVSVGSGALPAGQTIEVQIAGRGDVPAGVDSALMNLAAIKPDGNGYATLYPCTPEPPTAASLNYDDFTNISNTTLVKLSPSGSICIFTSNTAHYAIDVFGHVPSASNVDSVDPARLLETRTDPTLTTIDGDFLGNGTVAAGTSIEVQVAGRGGVPAGADSALLNLAGVQPVGPGYATLYPCTPEPPNAASLNYVTLSNISNATLVKLSPTGSVCIYTSNTAHYVLDVVAHVS